MATTPSESTRNPRVLPKGVFFICGDRAWAGIPLWLWGGPCTLGRLTNLTPNITLMKDWQKKNQLALQKRQTVQLEENCDSQITNWLKSKRVAASLFLTWVAAAKALGDLSHMACWLSKQANITSSALSNLLTDEETTRHATLKNRAAIDFLLLAHGHGCEDFEGLCCFNLSDHQQSIHARIQKLKDLVSKIRNELPTDWWQDLMEHWGFRSWTASILRTLLWTLFVIFPIVCALICFKCLLLRAVGNVF